MPKNKRPNRKPGGKKPAKRVAADQTQGDGTGTGGAVPNIKGAKSIAKSYGTRKSSRSAISPAMTRRSPRGR